MADFAPHLFNVRVYYEDTDFSGVVYHANYLRFIERARTEFLREFGVDQAALFETGLGFAVRSLTMDYLKPARMDDYLRVETRIDRLGRASLELVQEIWRGSEQLTQGRVRLAIVGQGRPRAFPAALYAKLKGLAGSEDKGAPSPS